jgi:anaerobic selenocysteine-containing dehydrogenase
MPGSTEVNPSRRTFLKGAAGVAAGTVFAELAGFGVDLSALAAKARKVPIKKGKEVASICPYCAVGWVVTIVRTHRPSACSPAH